MMAISRFRFALLLALFLALSVALVPEASAYRSNTAQILPDEDGDTPRLQARGAGGPPHGGRPLKDPKVNQAVAAESKTVTLNIAELILAISKALGLVL